MSGLLSVILQPTGGARITNAVQRHLKVSSTDSWSTSTICDRDHLVYFLSRDFWLLFYYVTNFYECALPKYDSFTFGRTLSCVIALLWLQIIFSFNVSAWAKECFNEITNWFGGQFPRNEQCCLIKCHTCSWYADSSSCSSMLTRKNIFYTSSLTLTKKRRIKQTYCTKFADLNAELPHT